MDNIVARRSSPNKGILPSILTGLLLVSLGATAQTNKTAIVGTWLNQEKAAKIDIYQQGDKFFGKIVWLKEPYENGKPKTDHQNPDKARQNDPIIGLVMLKDMAFDGTSTWEGGTIYDARSGKIYSCYLSLQADKSLKVRGYVGISLFGQSTTWTRTN